MHIPTTTGSFWSLISRFHPQILTLSEFGAAAASISATLTPREPDCYNLCQIFVFVVTQTTLITNMAHIFRFIMLIMTDI